jgi:hypothetical protein
VSNNIFLAEAAGLLRISRLLFQQHPEKHNATIGQALALSITVAFFRKTDVKVPGVLRTHPATRQDTQ